MGNFNINFPGAVGIHWPSPPRIISIAVRNVQFDGADVEADLEIKYDFNGEHDATEHFKATLNEQVSLPIGPLTAHFHVILAGAMLCFSLKVCIGPLCSDEVTQCAAFPAH